MTPADYIVGLLAVLVVAVVERLLSFGDGVENKVVRDAVRDALRDRLLGDWHLGNVANGGTKMRKSLLLSRRPSKNGGDPAD